jgi:hypothetical protein
MPKHTPGPWNIGGIFNPLSDRPICNVWGPTPPGKQSGEIVAKDCTLPNARLIAAAPRMYEALETLARLGNEPLYGNSDGNVIARETLFAVDGLHRHYGASEPRHPGIKL